MAEHFITPPPELVMQWVSLACEHEGNETWIDLATQAARWGADAELEACCEWLDIPAEWETVARGDKESDQLRAARRPKPPSSAEDALRILVENSRTFGGCVQFDLEDVVAIRTALKRLQELEGNG